jgi:hypothetical protein
MLTDCVCDGSVHRDLKWRADKKAAERARQLALKRAAHDVERKKGNIRLYRIAPRFDVDLSGARADVTRFEERVALAVVEEEAVEVDLARWKEELRTATSVTKELRAVSCFQLLVTDG